MKVAVDARMYNMSGIGTYIKNLMNNDCYDIALGNIEELKHTNVLGIVKFDAPIYGIKEQLTFPYKELKSFKPDILHVPHYNVPLFYKGNMIVTIHDLTHIVHSEFLSNKFAVYYAKFMMKIAIKKAKVILTVSENTKKDIIKYFGVEPEKIKVTYLGVDEKFKPKDKSKIEYLYDELKIPRNKKALMYVGNLKPHKNLERLLEAFSKMKSNDECVLLLVGKAFDNYNVLQDREKELNIQDKVIHTGIVSDKQLIDLYSLIDLFVFPSLYEGFGLPVLEAMACGAKVICSNSSSLPEVGGDKIPYFDPMNVDEMTEAIENELKRVDTNETIQSRIDWTRNFNWEKTSKEVKEAMALYEKQ